MRATVEFTTDFAIRWVNTLSHGKVRCHHFISFCVRLADLIANVFATLSVYSALSGLEVKFGPYVRDRDRNRDRNNVYICTNEDSIKYLRNLADKQALHRCPLGQIR